VRRLFIGRKAARVATCAAACGPSPRSRGRVGEGAPLAPRLLTCPLSARTDLGFTRDRQINMRKSGRPDLRARVPPPQAGEETTPACHLIPRRLATHRMRTIVFDLDGTLVDTAPDLLASLDVLFAREGIAPIDPVAGRALIGGGVKRLIERGLAQRGRT